MECQHFQRGQYIDDGSCNRICKDEIKTVEKLGQNHQTLNIEIMDHEHRLRGRVNNESITCSVCSVVFRDSNAVNCSYKDETDCIVHFQYSEDDEGNSILSVVEKPGRGSHVRLAASRGLRGGGEREGGGGGPCRTGSDTCVSFWIRVS